MANRPPKSTQKFTFLRERPSHILSKEVKLFWMFTKDKWYSWKEHIVPIPTKKIWKIVYMKKKKLKLALKKKKEKKELKTRNKKKDLPSTKQIAIFSKSRFTITVSEWHPNRCKNRVTTSYDMKFQPKMIISSQFTRASVFTYLCSECAVGSLNDSQVRGLIFNDIIASLNT